MDTPHRSKRHKPMLKGMTRAVSHTARQVWKDKRAEPEGTPLSAEQHRENLRLENEATRQEILRLRTEWAAHQARVWRGELTRPAL